MAIRRCVLLALVSLAISLTPQLHADQWPAYAHDNARSGVTTESLELPLSEHWVYAGRAAPIPVWPDPQSAVVEGNVEEPRVRFDDAYHVAVVDGSVYFGTSCDNKVYCLDAATGKERWSFFTEGPIRLAPAVDDGRVYVASDDGLIYCLSADDGSVLWRFAAAPTRERVLARHKMSSLHPPRTGVLVDDGVVYCSAGVFPGERVYLYAVRADDGSLIWKNDTISDGNAGQNGFSPQGYLLASDTILYVPSGRSLPAAFDKATGKFLFQRSLGWRSVGQVGGTYALLVGDHLYTGSGQVVQLDKKSGNLGFAIYPGRRLIVTPEVSYMLGKDGLSALNREDFPELSRKKRDLKGRRTALNAEKPDDLEDQLKKLGDDEKANNDALEACNLWKTTQEDLDSMILAGDTVFAGGKNTVVALNTKSGELVWGAKITGRAKGLAASDGRLLVSTDEGTIHCFAPGEAPAAQAAGPAEGYVDDDLAPVCEAAARAIASGADVEKGFGLVLGCGTGRLALELAKRTDLMIHAIDPDPEKVAAARRALDAEGVYGTRVCVDQGELSDLPYADYFANLVVSEEALVTGRLSAPPEEALRVLKPVGGTVYIGQPASAKGLVKPLKRQPLERWLKAIDRDGAEVSQERGLWGKVVRGPLEGAGSWTHQYGEPGNTASSEDTAVKAPLGVLWYGEPGAEDAVNRHAGTAAPLSINGRVYFQGVKEIICFDAYNGVQYWRREVPGAARTGMIREVGNLACNEQGLFVSTGKECLLLDAETGETVATYGLPPSPDDKARTWAYVALAGDTLYGSASAKAQQSDAMFALDIESGDPRWVHYGTNIRNNTITISDGRMFFADNSATSEQRQEALGAKVEELKEKDISGEEAEKELSSADVRVAVALDAKTGDILWQKPLDLTDCGAHVLSTIATNGVVLFCGSHWNGHFWPQFLGGDYGTRRITAINAEDGKQLWSKAIGYRIRPMVIGDTIYAEPWGFDLRTGEQKTRMHPLTGRSSIWQFERPGHHCGTISGSPNLLAFRSGSIAWYDLVGDYGVNHFAGQRPGCWINLIPANGLLLAPEASSGCVCLYSIHSTVVFKPRKQMKKWGIASMPGETRPVRRMTVNLGAPGDRRDPAGKLWLGYPRPGGRMLLKFDMQVSNLAGGGYFREAAEHVQVDGTDSPWLFASGCRSITQCRLPLIGEDDGAAVYTVRLGFADRENTSPGERVFDIKVQGEVVAENFDIVQAAGGADRAVFKEFSDIEVQEDLLVELVPKSNDAPPEQAPLLNTIEVERTRVLHVGLSAPSFLLNDQQPEQAAEVRITNSRDEGFEGTLRLAAPDGFSVTPAETEINLGTDDKTTVRVTLKADEKGDPADLQLDIKLLRANGEVESERAGRIEYLGRRGRIVLTPVEDSYVNLGQPAKNFGTVASLLVDGGDQKMGDRSYNIGYLKFDVDIPGKSVSVKFRIRTSAAGHSQSGDSGTIHLCEGDWDENKITYAQRPEPGEQVGALGKVGHDVWEERELNLKLSGKQMLTLVLVPTTADGATYHPREGAFPPELVIEYEPE